MNSLTAMCLWLSTMLAPVSETTCVMPDDTASSAADDDTGDTGDSDTNPINNGY